MKIKLSTALVILLVAFSHSVYANHVLSNCIECHKVSPQSDNAMTLDERMKRLGPSLYYAGNKYRQAWLESWLQNPARIHPGGVYYGKHTVVTDEGDIVEEAGLVDHPKLDAKQARLVAETLMTLTAKSELVEDIKVGEIKNVSRRMGSMNFTKFKGCASCHRDSPDEGGLSGPEIYTAFERLQLTYLISYLKDPVAWEPYSLMPNQGLKQKDVEKLVGYFKTLAEDKR